MASISSVMTFGMNKILIAFSSTAAAVFGVYFKLQSFVFMPVFGMNNGIVPIISYNYGAKKKKRILGTISWRCSLPCASWRQARSCSSASRASCLALQRFLNT